MTLPSKLLSALLGCVVSVRDVTDMNSTRSHLFYLCFMSSTIYIEDNRQAKRSSKRTILDEYQRPRSLGAPSVALEIGRQFGTAAVVQSSSL
jgi:hypothetical protein